MKIPVGYVTAGCVCERCRDNKWLIADLFVQVLNCIRQPVDCLDGRVCSVCYSKIMRYGNV